MTTWEQVAPALVAGEQLDYDAARDLMNQVMDGTLGDARLSSLLSLLAMRGIATDELHGLADAMRQNARPISLPRDVVDIVGTGGDQAHTVNISTMAAIVVAAAGAPVVKHGNRASTSSSGSADVLEALGVDLQVDPQTITRTFPDTKIAFLFANNFHPSMRHAAGVRRALGFPTAFNVLGPLTNPARPRASAVGVSREDLAPLVAGVFARRGDRALVFRGAVRGLDELTTIEAADVWEVRDGDVQKVQIDPAQLMDVPHAELDELVGGSPDFNAQVALDVFAGSQGPIADAVVINAAAALVAFDENAKGSLEERLSVAADNARRAIDDGSAAATLQRWKQALS